jgi:hypothetical protein
MIYWKIANNIQQSGAWVCSEINCHGENEFDPLDFGVFYVENPKDKSKKPIKSYDTLLELPPHL